MYNFIGRLHKFFTKIKGQRWVTFNGFAHVKSNYIRKRDKLKYIRRCRVAIIVSKSLTHLLKTYLGGFTKLRLCNRNDLEEIVEELNHIPTKWPVPGFKCINRLLLGLKGVDVIVLTVGIPRKPGISRKHLFMINTAICKDAINICADTCLDASIAIVMNPLDSLVPDGVLKKYRVYRPERLFGICQIDQLRARRFYTEAIGQEPKKVYVPVVGGHAETTTTPLFSKARSNSLVTAKTMTLINHGR